MVIPVWLVNVILLFIVCWVGAAIITMVVCDASDIIAVYFAVTSFLFHIFVIGIFVTLAITGIRSSFKWAQDKNPITIETATANVPGK